MGISDYISELSKGDVTAESTADIITFCESSWGLNMNRNTGNTILRPVQKLILKCYYYLPLDNKEKSIIVRDHLNEIERFRFTEQEYLHYLYNEGRTNIKEPVKGRNELVLVAGRRGGKTLASGTLVLTPTGPVPIDDLKVGDTIYGYNKDGTVSKAKVKNFFDHGVQEVVELINHNRVVAVCTPHHRWLTTNERQTVTSEMSPDQFGLRHGKAQANIVRRFVKIPCGPINEPHAYALGALLGDGCSRQPGNIIDISSESSIIPNKVAGILGASVKRSHDNCFTWILHKPEYHYSRTQKLECNHYDEWCRDRYAHEKVVDLNVIKTWNRKSLLNFLAGFFDTDGSVSRSGSELSLEFTSQSKSILDAVSYIFFTLFQYRLNFSTDNREKYVNGPCHRLRLKNNFFVKMALEELDSYLANPKRKWKAEYESCLANNSSPDYVGVKLGKRYKAQTYDIEVDNETNLYVLANQGVITHNSKIGALVCAYETYRLIKNPHPQKHYGITDNAEINLTTIATSTEQAEILFNDIASYVDACKYFEKYKNAPTLQYMKLRTYYDIQTTGNDGRMSIMIKAAPCSSRAARGPSNIVVVMDEQAHFVDNSANKSDTAIYDAITPSTLSFGKEAKILNLSSPLNKQGKLYELYQGAFGSEKILMFQIPSWELFPDIDSSELRERFRRNPDVYWCEMGAQFSDTVKSWMNHDALIKCIDPQLKPKIRGVPRVPHFMGIDIGLKKDPTAISILHIENTKEKVRNMDGKVIDEILVPKYELDYQEIMQPEPGQTFLDFDSISDRIAALCNEFYVYEGLFDQYNGVPLKQRLDKKGLTQFEMLYFDRRLNSELYNNFMLQTIDGRLHLYDEPPLRPDNEVLAINKESLEYKYGPFIAEVLELQSEFISKYITLVFAPQIEGKHDDRSDSFVRALWKATQFLTDHKDAGYQSQRPGQKAILHPAMMSEAGSLTHNQFYNRRAKYRQYMPDRPRSEGDRYSKFLKRRGRR